MWGFDLKIWDLGIGHPNEDVINVWCNDVKSCDLMCYVFIYFDNLMIISGTCKNRLWIRCAWGANEIQLHVRRHTLLNQLGQLLGGGDPSTAMIRIFLQNAKRKADAHLAALVMTKVIILISGKYWNKSTTANFTPKSPLGPNFYAGWPEPEPPRCLGPELDPWSPRLWNLKFLAPTIPYSQILVI